MPATALDLDTASDAHRSAAATWSAATAAARRVRKQIGAKLEGTPVIQRVQSTYIRAPQLLRADPGQARLVATTR